MVEASEFKREEEQKKGDDIFEDDGMGHKVKDGEMVTTQLIYKHFHIQEEEPDRRFLGNVEEAMDRRVRTLTVDILFCNRLRSCSQMVLPGQQKMPRIIEWFMFLKTQSWTL